MRTSPCPVNPRVVAAAEVLRRAEAAAEPFSSGFSEDGGHISTGVEALDRALPWGGLPRGAAHEWLGVSETPHQPWTPPMGMLLLLAGAFARAARARGATIWIGERIWPYPPALADAGDGLLSRALFVRASEAGKRLWAADLALRTVPAALVVADASGFDLSATRRLQLATKAGGGCCLMARPAAERDSLSAALTRWLVRRAASPTINQRWRVELLRCKGVRPKTGAERLWTLERRRATRDVVVVPELGDGSLPAPAALGVRSAG